MFTKSKIVVAALTTSLVFASGVQAKEVSVEEIVGSLVSQAMVLAQQEVQNKVQESILTATNSLSFNEEKSYVAKVTITDINVVEADKNKTE